MRFYGTHAVGLMLVAVALPLSAMAQAPSAVPAGGTVMGQVTCADTQRPARFASVKLFGIPEEMTPEPKPGGDQNSAKRSALFKATMNKLKLAETRTDAEGRFAMSGVAPGDYYAFAWMPGYLQPKTILQAASDAGAALDKPIPGIPIVHVVADRSSQVVLVMNRGAAVSGRVVWDDGGPVTGAIVSVVPTKGKEKALPTELNIVMTGLASDGVGTSAQTDDLGHFRIAGLIPGDYLVRAALETHIQLMMQGGMMKSVGVATGSPLEVFAPAAFHKADAKAVMLHAGEERDGEEIEFRLSEVYSVKGRVTSAEDGHGVNAASVRLRDVQDKEFSRWATVDDSGNFSVMFVPPGTYSLEVSDAGDAEPVKRSAVDTVFSWSNRVLRHYENGKQTVVVLNSDVIGQNFALTPAKAAKGDAGSGQADE